MGGQPNVLNAIRILYGIILIVIFYIENCQCILVKTTKKFHLAVEPMCPWLLAEDLIPRMGHIPQT